MPKGQQVITQVKDDQDWEVAPLRLDDPFVFWEHWVYVLICMLDDSSC